MRELRRATARGRPRSACCRRSTRCCARAGVGSRRGRRLRRLVGPGLVHGPARRDRDREGPRLRERATGRGGPHPRGARAPGARTGARRWPRSSTPDAAKCTPRCSPRTAACSFADCRARRRRRWPSGCRPGRASSWARARLRGRRRLVAQLRGARAVLRGALRPGARRRRRRPRRPRAGARRGHGAAAGGAALRAPRGGGGPAHRRGVRVNAAVTPDRASAGAPCAPPGRGAARTPGRSRRRTPTRARARPRRCVPAPATGGS